jgi:hypothetical protein
MDSDWQARVKELFPAVSGRRPEGRSSYLDEACGEDELVLDDARSPVRNIGFNGNGSEVWVGV